MNIKQNKIVVSVLSTPEAPEMLKILATDKTGFIW